MKDSSEHRYWLMKGDTPAGPYTVEQIHGKLAAGEITWQTPGCAVGESSWQPLLDLPTLGPRASSDNRVLSKPYDDVWDDREYENNHTSASISTRPLRVIPRLFRILIVVEIIIMFLYAGLEILYGVLTEDPAPQDNPMPTASDGFFCVTLALYFPAAIAGWTGMLLFRNWGRWLYLGVGCFGHIIAMGSSLFDFAAIWHFPGALASIGSTVSGILIGIAFFSPLSAEFRQPR